MKRTFALLLLIAAFISVSAASTLDITRVDAYDISGFMSRNIYTYLKITNTGETNSRLYRISLEAVDGYGLPVTLADGTDTPVIILGAGEYTYVRLVSPSLRGNISLSGYTFAFEEDDGIYNSTPRLLSVSRMDYDDSNFWNPELSIVVSVTNNTQVDIWNTAVVAALVTKEGKILYVADTCLPENIALAPGSTLTFKFPIPEDILENIDDDDLFNAEIDAIAFPTDRIEEEYAYFF